MRKYLLLIIPFVLSVICSNAQTTVAFRKNYNVATFDLPANIVEGLTPNTYVMAGTNLTFIPIYGTISQINDTGGVMWSYRYSDASIGFQLNDIKKDAANSQYFACGGSESNAAVFMVTDASGTVVISKKFSISEANGAWFNRVIKASDGGYVAVGYVTGYDPDGAGAEIDFNPITYTDNNGDSQTDNIGSPLIVKLDASGNHVWHKVFRYYTAATMAAATERIYNDASFTDVVEVSDGYVAVGSYDVNQHRSAQNSDGDDATPNDALILKTTTAGAITYHKQIDNPSTSTTQTSKYLSAVNTVAAGSYITAGNDNGKELIQKFAGPGGFSNTFSRVFTYSSFFGTPDPVDISQIYEVAGSTDLATMSMYLKPLSFLFTNAIHRVNPTATTNVWAKYYTFNLLSLLPRGGLTSDNGYISMSMTAGGTNYDYHVIKTDPAGDTPLTGCAAVSFTPTAGAGPSTFADPYYRSWSGTPGANTLTITKTTITPTVSYVCTKLVCTPPAAATTVTATPATICSGQSSSITASGPATAASYQVWTASTGGSNLGTTPLTVSPTGTTTYYIQTVSNSDANCVSTTRVPVTVTVNTPPTATISYSAAAFCQTAGAQTVTQTGTTGGTYSSTAGLTINTTNGTITPSSSTPGTYIVNYNISASAPCSAYTTSTTVQIISSPSASFSYPVNPVCSTAGVQTPTFTGTSGGTYSSSAGLTINPTTGEITPSTSTPGTYTVNYDIPAGGGCAPYSTSASITINTAPSATISYTGAAGICQNASTLTVTLTGAGGGTYSSTAGLSLNATNGSITPGTSTPGTYTVTYTLTGTGGCSTFTTTASVTINSAPTASAGTSAGITDFCSGSNVSFTSSGGGNYSWTGPASFSSILQNPDITGATNVNSGTYIVTVTDANSCQDTAMVMITIHTPPDVSTTGTNLVNPSACGFSDGQITGITVAGVPVLSYSWNGGPSQASPDLTGIPAGSYSLTVTDGNGCVATAGPFSINDPSAPPAPTLNTFGGAVCEGGTLTLSVNAPNGSATYNWTGPNGSLGAGTSITVTPVTAADTGSYSVQATMGGCTGSATSVNVSMNPAPVAVITSASGTGFCAGDSLTLSGTSSAAPSPATITSYQWQLAGVNISGATDSTYNASTAGNYTLIITNSNSCSDTSTGMVITQNTPPDVNATSAVYDSSSCNGATGGISGITASGTGNTYNWYNDTTLISSSTTTPDLTGQAAGNSYYLEVISSFGCRDTAGPFTINNIVIPPPALSNNNNTISYCQNDTIAAVIASSTLGGVINWYSDAALTILVAADTNSYTPAAANGTYYVTETAMGCVSTASSVTININALPTVSANASQSSVCSGGTTTLTGSGTAGTYTWNNGVTDGVPFVPASALTYIVTGTDNATGCSDTASISITLNSNPVLDISAMVSDSSSCNGSTGAITGIVPDTANYTYNWYNGTTLISTSDSTSDLTAQSAGVNYYLEVIDQNGCRDTVGPLTINNIAPPAAPALSTSAVAYCQGDIINPLTATPSAGGTINWYSDAGLTTNVAANTNTFTPPSVTATYYVTETLAGCISAASTVTVTINALPNVTANSSSASGVCTGSSVTLTGGGASSYSWNNGVLNGVAFTPSGTLTYTVTGTDATTGCTDTANITVNVNPLPVIDTLGLSVSPANCGESVGGVSGIIISSGQPPYVYQWSDGSANVGSSLDLTNVGAGTYTLTVTDGNGCVSQSAGVNVNATPGVTAAFTASSNIGPTPFTVTFTNASIGAINYLWDFGGLDTSHAISPAYIFEEDGIFTVCLTADNGAGCLDTACTKIEVYTDSYIIIPNIFSPNNDGTNDYFYVKSKGLESLSGEIYDRWGLLMYQLDGVASKWDGRTISGSIATDGVYFYMIRAKGKDKKEYDQKGSFTLVR